MKFLKIFAAVAAGTAVFLLVAAGIGWVLFDPNDYRATIAEEFHRATGRELGIKGQIHLRIWPHLSLQVSDLGIANSPGGSRPEFVTIADVEADLALRPLLERRLEFKRVKLRGLDALLETGADGVGNWEIGTRGALSDPASPAPVINMLILEQALIAYQGKGANRPTELRLERAEILDASLGGHGRISATGSLNEEAWDIQGTFGPRRAGTNGAVRYPLSLALSIAGANAKTTGHIDSPLGESRVALQISVQGQEVADLFASLGVVIDPVGSYGFSAELTGNMRELELESIQVRAVGISAIGEASIDLEDAQTPGIEFRNLELTWRGMHDELPHAAQVERLDVRLRTDVGRIEADYAGRISEIAFAGSGRFGRSAAARDSPFDVELETTFGDAKIQLDAAVQPHESGPTGSADLRVTGPDLVVPADAVGLQIPLSGPYDFQAKVVRGAGSSLGLTLGLKMASLDASLAGEVPATLFEPEDWAAHALNARLSASASGPEVANWMKAFGVDVPLQGAFKATAKLVNSRLDAKVEITDVNTRYEVSAKASLDRGPSSERPIVFRDLQGEAILSGEDGTWIASSLEMEGLRLGPYAGHMKFRDGSLQASFELALWEGSFRVDGAARVKPDVLNSGFESIESFEAGLSLSGGDVSRLMEPFGWKTELGGAFKVEGRASGNLKKAVLRDLHISAGDARLQGNAGMEFFEPSPGIMSIPAVKILAVRNIEAAWNTQVGSPPVTLKLKHASLDRDAIDAAIRLSATGEIDDRQFEAEGEGGSWTNLVDSASPYRVTLKGEMGKNMFSTKGVLGKPLGSSLNRLAFEFRGGDLADLGALAGMDLPNTRPFGVTGVASFGSQIVSLKQLSARVGKSDLSGTLTLDLASAPPIMKGRLTSKVIDLQDISISDGGGTPSELDAKDSEENLRLHGDVPLPAEILQSLDADFGIKIGELRYGDAKLTDTSLLVRGSEGHIAVELRGASAGQTGLEGQADLDVTPEVPTAVMRFRGQDIDVGQLLEVFEVTDLITASANVEARVQGRGHSVHEILESLDGSASIVADGGRIESEYFDLVVSDLARKLLPWRPKSQHTDINCFVARFGIEDGVATTEGLLLDTTRATIAGEGSVNLGSEELEFTVRPNPKEMSLVSLAFPIDIRGTIAAPKFRPNKKALAIDAAKVAVATAINPLGILVPFVRAGIGDKNPCVAALEEASSGTAPQQAEPKGFGGKLLKGLGGAVKGIGGAVDKVLGK